MKAIWIVVADRSRARIFRAPNPAAQQLEEVEDFVFPQGAMRPRELNTDRAGAFADEAHGFGSGDPAMDHKHLTAERFAGLLVERLEQARNAGDFDKVVLAAGPLLLGALRNKMPAPLARMVSHEVNKDLTSLRPEEIRRHLPDVL